MANVEKLLTQMEIQGYLEEESKQIIMELKKNFPGLEDVRVVINVWFGPVKKDYANENN